MTPIQSDNWQQLMAQVEAVLTGLHLELGDWESVEHWLSGAIALRDFEGGRDEA